MNIALHRQSAERSGAFTLLEMLMVLAIIGMLTGLTLPFLKGLSHSNTMSAATRQLLDDVGYARHKAIAAHTTVYMVFIPPADGSTPSVSPEHMRILATGQATTYSYFTRRSLGDQPGEESPNYVTKWYSLPQGTFIPEYKFALNPAAVTPVGPPDPPQDQKVVKPFLRSTGLPVPATVANGGVTNISIPYLAFDYQGRLVDETGTLIMEDQYIPIAQGSIFYERDASGNPTWGVNTDIRENPVGNSMTNYNLIRIDSLTGRARIEQRELPSARTKK